MIVFSSFRIKSRISFVFSRWQNLLLYKSPLYIWGFNIYEMPLIECCRMVVAFFKKYLAIESNSGGKDSFNEWRIFSQRKRIIFFFYFFLVFFSLTGFEWHIKFTILLHRQQQRHENDIKISTSKMALHKTPIVIFRPKSEWSDTAWNSI